MKSLKQLLISLSHKIINTWETSEFEYDEVALQCGDVFWCIMPLSKQALMQVPPGHRIRPYVLTHQDDTNAYGYACSSSISTLYALEQQILLDRFTYSINKHSYVNTSKEWCIPLTNLQQFYFHLNDEDIKLIQTSSLIRPKPVKKHVQIGIGCVIEHQKRMYYVSRCDDAKFYVYPLWLQKQVSNHLQAPLSCHGTIYYIDFSKEISLSIQEEYKLHQTFSKADVITIRQKRSSLLKKKEQKTYVQPIFHYTYEPGTYFIDPIKGLFTYVFSRYHNDYGIYINELQKDKQTRILRKVNCASFTRKGKCELSFFDNLLKNTACNEKDQEVINKVRKEAKKPVCILN